MEEHSLEEENFFHIRNGGMRQGLGSNSVVGRPKGESRRVGQPPVHNSTLTHSFEFGGACARDSIPEGEGEKLKRTWAATEIRRDSIDGTIPCLMKRGVEEPVIARVLTLRMYRRSRFCLTACPPTCHR
jgi:hypothetical protein